MTSFWQDVRYALRVVAKAPGYAATAIVTLALGIGANTTIFSWIHSTLLNPIPGLANTGDLVALSLGTSPMNAFPFTYPDYLAMRDGQQTFSGITMYAASPMSLTGSGKPERTWGVVASANYFDVLGVHPILGPGFLPVEDEHPGGAPVVVISYRLWQTHFGGDPNVVGRNLDINQHPYAIVGVMPSTFQGSQTGLRSDLWLPIMMQSQVMAIGDLLRDHHYFWLSGLGRLKPGVTLAQAQSEMNLRIQGEFKAYPREHKGHTSVTLTPMWRAPFSANAFFSLLLPMLLAISGLVLLLACANVANLMLVRSNARRRELAIRMSLGGSRWRLVRQLLVESLVLALAGGGLAMAITLWTAGSMTKFIPATDFPISLTVRADRSVLFATLAISLLTGLIFGILPALRASGQAPVSVLKEEGNAASGVRGKMRLASGLVVVQVSLSLLLLICAGLFIRSFASAQHINPGFNPRGVLITSYDLFQAGLSPDQGMAFDRQMVARLSALPGVQSVALSSRTPLSLGGGSTSVKPEGYLEQANESMEVQYAIVTPDFLKTLQNPIISGRDLTPQDTLKSQRVVLVNQYFVDRYWPNQQAIGKHLHSDLKDEWYTVVGVVANSKVNSLNESPTPFIYLPLYQVYRDSMTAFVRVNGNAASDSAEVQQAFHEANANLALFDATTLEDREKIASFVQRLAGTLVGIFGMLALVLAAVGIYGVTSYTMRQRTHEIGIRMALGATRGNVLSLVLGHGLRLTLIGVALGLLAAFGLTPFLSSQLLGVTSRDTMTFGGVAILLCVVAMCACFIPARRATHVDPLVALRYE